MLNSKYFKKLFFTQGGLVKMQLQQNNRKIIDYKFKFNC